MNRYDLDHQWAQETIQRCLKPYIQQRPFGFVFADGSWIAKKLQTKFNLDAVFNTAEGVMRSLEIKCERKFTGNVFLETWSNHPTTRGWFYTSQADWLWYFFADVGRLYMFDLPALRRWARGHLNDYRERSVNRSQPNFTLGRAVPISVLANVDYVRYVNVLVAQRELEGVGASHDGDAYMHRDEAPRPRRLSMKDRLRAYETAKATWIALHPAATADEVQEAIVRIARECRV